MDEDNLKMISNFICNNLQSMIQSTVQTYLENRICDSTNNSTIEVLTVDDLADLFKVSKPIAYELVSRNDFPSFKVGKLIRIYKSELMRWLIEQSAIKKGE